MTQSQSQTLSTDLASTVNPVAIDPLSHPVISEYFATLNAGDFTATGQLFAPDGVLLPPFTPPQIGASAIAAYLEAEAQGFHLQPHQGTMQPLDTECVDYQITGKVQTPLFTVNVAWQFILNSHQEIVLAKIKLLASLQELAKWRR